MSCKPAHVAAAASRPEGRDVIWREIRALKRFSIFDLECRTRMGAERIKAYVVGLTNAGYLARAVKVDPLARAFWGLVRDVGVEAPRVRRDGTPVTQGAARDQMWRTMKVLKAFSYVDLQVAASTETSPIDRDDAKHYCSYLARAGYLAISVPGGPNRPGRYRFVRNTGPKAPQVQRVKQVFDPNLKKVMWPLGRES